MSFNPYEPPAERIQPAEKKPPAGAGWALGLGIFAMIAWCLPLVGVPVSGIGLYLGIRGLNGKDPSKATVAVVLCAIGLVLCLVNMAAAVYLMMTGQNALFNKLQGQ